jgi:tetratricopeptide (TPR) repeat protein
MPSHRRRGPRPLGSLVSTLALALSGHAIAQDGKVPITTKSQEARALYLKGRDLQEKLRATDAHEQFRKAVAADKDFALAQLGLANTAPSAKEFFEALKQATSLVSSASEGERHLVLATDAGARGDQAAQKLHIDRLTAAFPRDERAFNALGAFHFGRQEYEPAIAAYEKAIAINPAFSQPYNQMGYAYRFLGRNQEAERAFKKYIELIPDDPNPYDSYAELLMKLGRFDESIRSYEKALSVNPHFVASYIGIGLDQVYLGQPAKARETWAKLARIARNGGEKRAAYAQVAFSYIDEGDTAAAVAEVEKMKAVARQEGDTVSLSGDANLLANIYLEAGRLPEAKAHFAESLRLAEAANTPADVKDAARRQDLFDQARVALAQGDLAGATARADAYAAEVARRPTPFQLRQTHEIAGLIALEKKDHVKAVAELTQANLLDPRVQYHLARAYQGKGDAKGAREAARQAADHNGLNFNYAYVRAKAKKLVAQI